MANATTQIGAAGPYTGTSVALNTFSHAVITFDGTTLTSYLNGVKGSATPTFGAASTIGQGVLGTLAIGGRGSSEESMTGLIDDVSLWGETLTDGKAIGLFNLAVETELNYDASQAFDLFEVFDGNLAEAAIDNGSGTLVWTQASGLGGAAGDVVNLGDGSFFLNLDGTDGVLGAPLAVPEPASIAIWMLIGLGLAGYSYRRRKS